MRKAIVILCMVCLQMHAIAQKEEHQRESGELKVGDMMPDIPLGTVVNNYTGKTSFVEFRGKLIILDFWNSACSSCIANFPHMSELQKKFADRIQIFLVNHEETQQEIESFFSRVEKYKNKKLIPDNLPSIVSKIHGDNILNTLFPNKGETGYHVWIDPNGIIQLRGPGIINTTELKIREILTTGNKISYITDEGLAAYQIKEVIAGKKVSYVTNEGAASYRGLFPPPLYTVLPKIDRPIVQYYSIITKLADEIGAYSGSKVLNQVDSSAGIIRSCFLNYSVEDLCQFAVQNQNTVFESKINLNKVGIIPQIVAEDRFRYTSYSEDGINQMSEQWLRDNAFCYEQITPLDFTEEVRRKYMLEDLNRYFGNLYGAECRLEKKKTSCWVILNKTSLDKFKSKSGRFSREEINRNGRPVVGYKNMYLNDILVDIVESNATAFKIKNFLPLINTTNYDDVVDMEVPKEIKTIEELRRALASYGFTIIKGERMFTRLVIREAQ